MSLIVLFPPLALLASLLFRGFRSTLVTLMIPIALLLPAYYTHKLPGIPVASFHNYSWALMLAALALGAERGLLKLHVCDLIPVAYCAWTVGSEFSNKGWPEAQNLLAVRLMGVVAPYYLGKAVARSSGLLCGLLLVMAIVAAAIGAVAPFEARFGRNPFDFWRNHWPHSVPWEGALYRFGLRRVAGPFAHPICQGFFFSMLLPLTLWIRDARLTKKRWTINLVLLGQVIGLFLSGSRGPWIGTFLACSLPIIFWMRARAIIVATTLTLTLIGALAMGDSIAEYMSINRGQAKTQEQETVAYRWEMLDHYLELVEQRPALGFGKDNIPVVKGMKSIDNQYLYTALLHGLPAATLFLATMLFPAAILFFRSLRSNRERPLTRLSFALTGVIAGAIFTQGTVFAGTQTEQLLFLFTGAAIALSDRLRFIPSNQMGIPDES